MRRITLVKRLLPSRKQNREMGPRSVKESSDKKRRTTLRSRRLTRPKTLLQLLATQVKSSSAEDQRLFTSTYSRVSLLKRSTTYYTCRVWETATLKLSRLPISWSNGLMARSLRSKLSSPRCWLSRSRSPQTSKKCSMLSRLRGLSDAESMRRRKQLRSRLQLLQRQRLRLKASLWRQQRLSLLRLSEFDLLRPLSSQLFTSVLSFVILNLS